MLAADTAALRTQSSVAGQPQGMPCLQASMAVGLKGGWQHIGSAAWSVPLVVSAGLFAACEWELHCQLCLGRGWLGSPSSLVTSMYLLRAFPYGTPGMFSPGTLLISFRKIPLTTQSLFLLRVLWPHPSNYDSFGGSKPLLHPQCLPRAQSWVHKFGQSQVPGVTVLLKNKDGPRLASCPGRNPGTSVQRGCLGGERQVTLPLLVQRLQAEALCKGRRKQCQVDAWTSP